MSSVNRDVFSEIYRRGLWGRDPKNPSGFFSGDGSRAPEVVAPYLRAMSTFLAHFQLIEMRKPDMIDIGCGDFSVGSHLRPLCRSYLACDVVPELIESNQKRYSELKVDFRCLDAEHDWLPAGDIIVIRQVLQHLGNRQIETIIRKVEERCSFLIVTEHLPLDADFTPNIDLQTGGFRLLKGSGVVLTEPPFNLRPKMQTRLAAVQRGSGTITTTLYRL